MGGQPEKESLRGEEGLSTYIEQESEILLAQNIWLIFGPTRQGKPEKESLRGGRDHQLILNKSLRSCVPRIFG